MKIVTAGEMASLDRLAIEKHGIPGLRLMERAGLGIFHHLRNTFPSLSQREIHLVCGKGNNGGDGFVVARLLCNDLHLQPVVWLVGDPDDLTGDALSNWDRLDSSIVKHINVTAQEFRARTEQLTVNDLIVDALLGTGIKGPARPPYCDWIEAINASSAVRVAIDLPSGMDGDHAELDRPMVRADITLTMGLPKRGLLCQGNLDHVGELKVVPLGMPSELLEEDDQHPSLFGALDAVQCLPPRKLTAAKWDAGRLLVVAGSETMSGAGALVANAAVLAGAGLVQLVSADGSSQLHPSLRPEVLTGGELNATRSDSIVIGPGLGTSAAQLLTSILDNSQCPAVIDADALLPFVGIQKRWREREIVLTPHIGEMARMIGQDRIESGQDRLELAAHWAREWNVTLLLKGARTIVAASDGRLSVNDSGNPWMASGGMGDTLAGVLGALLAQGVDTYKAAQLAAYLHGAAADKLLDGAERPLAASDVAEMLPLVWAALSNKGNADLISF
jgi:ADP-dependent NAD(P)H-hydrate dehydratase / NAD(P)H-hydrate epimerase